MKNHYLYIIVLSTVMCAMLSSCKKDEPDRTTSVFSTDPIYRNAFDKWLLVNYVDKYNVSLKYHMEDIELDPGRTNVVPAEVDKSILMAKLIRHCWLEAYDEAANLTFTRKYAPKIIHLIGSNDYNEDGTIVLGTASGGLKITINAVNELDLSLGILLSPKYFHVMHHEFGHILNQTKKYSAAFNNVSKGLYSSTGWYNKTEQEAAREGFVTRYAGNAPEEDFVEFFSTYILKTPAEWNAILVLAGSEGAGKINEKYTIVSHYLRESWDIDIDALRDICLRRASEIQTIDYSI